MSRKKYYISLLLIACFIIIESEINSPEGNISLPTQLPKGISLKDEFLYRLVPILTREKDDGRGIECAIDEVFKNMELGPQVVAGSFYREDSSMIFVVVIPNPRRSVGLRLTSDHQGTTLEERFKIEVKSYSKWHVVSIDRLLKYL